MQLKRTNFVSHITTLARLVVFLSVIGFLLVSALLTQRAISTAQTSISINNTYQNFVFTLAKEEMLQREYALHPSTTLRDAHLATTTVLSNLLLRLQQQAGSDDNASLIQPLITLQTRYLFSSDQFFAAIDAGDATRANAILSQDVNPTFNRITQLFDQQMKREEAKSTQALAQLTAIQQIIFMTGPIFFVIGIALLGITMYIMKTYRGKLDEATHTEIARLERLALTNPLTNLGNHYAYQEELTRVWEEADRSHDTLVLASLDIDDFKQLNDEQGHQRGDEILLGVAAVLRDVHGSNALFHLSADDFVVLLPHTTPMEASIVFKRVCEDIQRRFWGVTVSIGITHTGSENLTLEAFQAQSLLALQEAKREGRNRVLAFEEVVSGTAFVSLSKRQAMRRILKERRLSIAFQPIWDLSTGTVLAFEALARPDADMGFMGPQELFDVAEQMGRAHELDVVCVQAILARVAELPSDALLFMNLTPQSLTHDLLTGAALLEMVISAGLEPSRVVLEITERSVVKLTDVVQKSRYLQMLGFRIALDDAGAGNAGLEMLSHLAVDFIKIDRAVVANALTDQAMRSVFAGITTIAYESHISVVAEGIETVELLDFVLRSGVQCAQGYLLGRPSFTLPEKSKTLQDIISLSSKIVPETSSVQR